MYTGIRVAKMDTISRGGEFGNAEQWVYHHLRRWILEGVLTANEEINQQDLANRLGVSRSPVRDALRRLKGMGLVTVNPNQRAVVTSLTLDNMREIFEMRAALEGLAARHATPALSESDLIELESLAQVMLRLSELDAYLAKHETFHDLIAIRAGMPRLRNELTRLRAMATPYIRIYGTARLSAELIGERHERLIEVLRERDPDKACNAFACHARAAYDQLAAEVAHLIEQPEDEDRAPPARQAIETRRAGEAARDLKERRAGSRGGSGRAGPPREVRQ